MWLKDLFTKHLGLKFLAIVMAVVLWFVAVGRESAEVGLKVPLEMINFPSNMIIANQVPDGISVRIRGSVALTRQVAGRKLRFSLNLAESREGPNNFTLRPEALDLPRGLEVTHLAPSVITVELERLTVKKVGLLPVIQGAPAAGYLIDEITLEPKEVDVRGPERLLSGLSRLRTEPVDVTNLIKSATIPTKLALTDVSLSLVEPVSIKAHLKIREKIVTRPFKRIPVEAVNAVNEFVLYPKNVELLIRGPLNTMTELVTGKGLSVVLDLEGLTPGWHRRQVEVKAPENMAVLKVRPKTVRVKVLEEPLSRDNDLEER